MNALPMQLNALTNRASGAAFCRRSMSDSFCDVKYCKNTVHGRRIGNWVTRIDDRLASQMSDARRCESGLGARAFGRQNDDLGELRGVLEIADCRLAVRLRSQLVALGRGVRTDRDLEAALNESVGQGLTDNTRSDDADSSAHLTSQ
jgi:hypothetical protein